MIPAIDARFRTQATRDARGIGGKSSGGFGALVLAMRHAALFSAVACHSGDAYFELSVIPDIPKTVRTLRRHGGIEGFLRYFDATEAKRPDDITAIMMLALGACYSPDPTRPLGHRAALRPRDRRDRLGESGGAGRRGIRSRWSRRTPSALRALSLLFIDAGTRDEWSLDLGARVLTRRLAALSVRFEHQEFDDGHRSINYRYDVSLPKLAAALGAT